MLPVSFYSNDADKIETEGAGWKTFRYKVFKGKANVAFNIMRCAWAFMRVSWKEDIVAGIYFGPMEPSEILIGLKQYRGWPDGVII